MLRLLIALALAFMAPVASAWATSGAHPATSGMAGCAGEHHAPADRGLTCDMACPGVCVVTPSTPAVAGPLVHPEPVLFHSTSPDRGGISIRPDYPPPR